MMVWQVDNQWKTIGLNTVMTELQDFDITAEKLAIIPRWMPLNFYYSKRYVAPG